jgi:hypothetical protein
VPNTDEITPAAAQQLCDMMRPEVGKWRDAVSTDPADVPARWFQPAVARHHPSSLMGANLYVS